MRFPGKVNWVSRLRFQSKKKVLIETMQLFFAPFFATNLKKIRFPWENKARETAVPLTFFRKHCGYQACVAQIEGRTRTTFSANAHFIESGSILPTHLTREVYVEGDRDSNPGLQVLCPFLHCLSGSFIANNVFRVFIFSRKEPIKGRNTEKMEIEKRFNIQQDLNSWPHDYEASTLPLCHNRCRFGSLLF